MVPLYMSHEPKIKFPFLWWLCQRFSPRGRFAEVKKMANLTLGLYLILSSDYLLVVSFFVPTSKQMVSHRLPELESHQKLCNIKLLKDPSALSSCPGICWSECWKPQYNPSLGHRHFLFFRFYFCRRKPEVTAISFLFFLSSIFNICLIKGAPLLSLTEHLTCFSAVFCLCSF